MAELQRIRALPTSSRAVTTSPGGGGGSALPADLLREASRRLGILALALAGLALIDLVLGYTLFPRIHVPWPLWMSIEVLAVALVSVGVFLYTRYSRSRPESFITLGLAYAVAISASLAFAEHIVAPPEAFTDGPRLSRVSFILLILPVFVPARPRAIFVAGMIGASMNPLAMATVGAARSLSVPLGHLFYMHITNYFSVGVAVIMSQVITRLGRQVRDARDLGSYRLGELLGRGGMGEVYTATHRMLARTAAIKLIRPEMIGAVDSARAELAIKRFRREAEAAANLRSPHTVELYDFGIAEDRTLYFVMELLDGLDLETLVQQFGPVPADRAVYILVQACASLAEAHARGLVHRDIKPANIHLGRMGLEHDFVKVLDFGLVKSVTGNVAESRETAAGIAPGTPAYMAPEMALGDSVDGRADLYALGCVAYWLVTGRLVFEAASPLQVIARHLNEVPVPPSARTQQDIPPALDRLILSCLAKKPEQRPASADELASALRAVPVREAWTEAKAARWWSTNRPAARHENRGVRGHAVATAVVPGNS